MWWGQWTAYTLPLLPLGRSCISTVIATATDWMFRAPVTTRTLWPCSWAAFMTPRSLQHPASITSWLPGCPNRHLAAPTDTNTSDGHNNFTLLKGSGDNGVVLVGITTPVAGRLFSPLLLGVPPLAVVKELPGCWMCLVACKGWLLLWCERLMVFQQCSWGVSSPHCIGTCVRAKTDAGAASNILLWQNKSPQQSCRGHYVAKRVPHLALWWWKEGGLDAVSAPALPKLASC